MKAMTCRLCSIPVTMMMIMNHPLRQAPVNPTIKSPWKKSIVKQQISRQCCSNEHRGCLEFKFCLTSDTIRPSTNLSESRSARSQQPTIVSLAKNYRLHYVKMLRETIGTTNSSQCEKRPLDSPSPPPASSGGKRPCPSSSTTTTLQALRNQIRNEDNEQFYFNDERRM
jgi:hypothetical protein